MTTATRGPESLLGSWVLPVKRPALSAPEANCAKTQQQERRRFGHDKVRHVSSQQDVAADDHSIGGALPAFATLAGPALDVQNGVLAEGQRIAENEHEGAVSSFKRRARPVRPHAVIHHDLS